MEVLPLELRQHISSFLCPQISPKDITAVPVSTQASRTDIYNLRLASHRLNAGAQHAFILTIGDVPTQCEARSLQYLDALVALPELGGKITHLTFHACKLCVDAPIAPEMEMEKVTDDARK